jgi:hypothetical protein
MADEWTASTQEFWDSPPQEWYELIKAMRTRAQDYGKPPKPS